MTDAFSISGPERELRDNAGRRSEKSVDNGAKDAFARAIEEAPGSRTTTSSASGNSTDGSIEQAASDTQSTEGKRDPQQATNRADAEFDVGDKAIAGRPKQVGKNAREAFARLMDGLAVARDQGASGSGELARAQDPAVAGRQIAAMAKSVRRSSEPADEAGKQEALEPQSADAALALDPSQVTNVGAPQITALADGHMGSSGTPGAQTESRSIRWGLDRGLPSSIPEHADVDGSAADPSLVPTVKVSHQETHFAPVMDAAATSPARRSGEPQGAAAASTDSKVATSSVTTAAVGHDDLALEPDPVWVQVADTTVALLSDSEAEQPEQVSNARPLPDNELRGGPVRIVKLQLNPESMGTIDVVLSKRHDGLSVHLDAQLTEVAGQLREDRAVLAERLTSAGHRVAELSIGSTTIPQDPAQASARMGQDQNQAGNPWTSGDAERQASARSGRDHQEAERRQGSASHSSTGRDTEQPEARPGVSISGFRAMRSV